MAFSDVVSVIGALISGIGLIVSVYVLLNTREIRKELSRRVRVPELINELQMHVADLESTFEAFETSRVEVDKTIKKCKVTLNHIPPNLGKSVSESIATLRNSIHYCNPSQEWKVERVFSDLQALIHALQQFLRDQAID